MILIRADANENIGTGHVMRCLSIARAFAYAGKDVLFVTADHRGDKLIKSKGFNTICLDSNWTDMENEGIGEIITTYNPELILVDSYFITQLYISDLTSRVKTAYVDDINKSVWDVNTLIDYNIFGTEIDYSGYNETQTKLLLGPKYAPLRDEFKNCPAHNIKDVKDIFVSAGGTDPQGITEKLMETICRDMNEVHFHFIVGALNPRLNDIKKLAESITNTILHINENSMAQLMRSCDIAISAAGSTLYELCAVGIPTITYTLADNQLMLAEEFECQGIMLSAGDCRGDDGFIRRLEGCLRKLVDAKDMRQKLSKKMKTLVDGNGTERIVEELLSLVTACEK